jgi:hypothetical protein
MCYNIPEGWRVCCENVFAKHSIHYTNLDSYIYMFSIWNEHNVCLSWSETTEWSELLEIPLVPILYKGIYNEELIRSIYNPIYNGNECEGYVLRSFDSFEYKNFRKNVVKYVRSCHITGNNHWRNGPIIQNGLKDDS